MGWDVVEWGTGPCRGATVMTVEKRTLPKGTWRVTQGRGGDTCGAEDNEKQGRRHGFLPGVAKANGGLHPEGASWRKGPLFEILSNVLNRRISEARTSARLILLC